MKTIMNVVLSVFFVAFGVSFVFAYEFYIKERIDTVQVVVASETIEFKGPITEENISIVNVKRGNEVENGVPVTAYKSLIGKYASVKIEKGTQVYMDLIDTYNLVPDSSKGEFVAPIPKEWLYAVPGSLRRTYVADVYAINDKDTLMRNALLIHAQEQGEAEGSTTQTSIVPNAEPILKSVRVSSVKDNGNKEVRESTETSDATGQVAALEIIANDEMLETITNAMNDGYKLYVVYKFERTNDIVAAEEQETEEVTEEKVEAREEVTIEFDNVDEENSEPEESEEGTEELTAEPDNEEEEEDDAAA